MANLTLVIEDAVLRRARIKAAADGTSVNAVVRDHLAQWVSGADARSAAARSLVDASKRVRSRRGAARWTRDELHER
jgi:plasmid stability protein